MGIVQSFAPYNDKGHHAFICSFLTTGRIVQIASARVLDRFPFNNKGIVQIYLLSVITTRASCSFICFPLSRQGHRADYTASVITTRASCRFSLLPLSRQGHRADSNCFRFIDKGIVRFTASFLSIRGSFFKQFRPGIVRVERNFMCLFRSVPSM